MSTKSTRGKNSRSKNDVAGTKNTSPVYSPNFHSLFDNLLEGCMLIAFDWTYLYLNEAAARHGHGKRAELLGRSMLEVYPGVEQSEIFARYRACMEQRTPQRFESSFTFENGAVNWYELRVEPAPEGILVLSLDITESKQAQEVLGLYHASLEEQVQTQTSALDAATSRLEIAAAANKWMEAQLNESDQRFRLALRNAPVSVSVQDRDLKFVGAYNQRSATPEQIIGHFDQDIFTPDEAARLTQIKRRILAEDICLDEQMWLERPTGKMYLHVFFEPIHDSAGRVIGVGTATVDLTAIKLAEEWLAASEKKYRELVQFASVAIYELDYQRNRFVEVNDVVTRLTGYTRAELLNMSPLEILAEEDRALFSGRMSSWLQGEAPAEHVEFHVKTKDGRDVYAMLNATFTRDANGAPLGAIVIGYDITERKLLEMRLQRLNVELDERVRTRTAELIAANQGLEAEIAEHKRDEQELRNRAADLAIIDAVNDAANRGETVQGIATAFVNAAHDSYRCRSAAVYLLSPDRQYLEMLDTTLSREATDFIEKKIGRPLPLIRLPFDQGGYFAHIHSDANGVILNTPQELQGWFEQFVNTTSLPFALRTPIKKLIPAIRKFLNIRSTLILPLVSDGNMIGMLDMSGDKPFTAEHLARMQKVVPQITSAIVRRQAEQALHESEARFFTIFQSGPLAIALTRVSDGIIEDVNPAWEELIGFTREEAVGHTAFELNSWVEPAERQRLMQAIGQPGQIGKVEALLRCKSGKIISAIMSGGMLTLANKTYLLTTALDTTERKQAEEALRESEEKYRGLIESLDTIVSMFDVNGRLIYLNGVAAEQFGGTMPGMIGKTIHELFPEPVASRQLASIQRVFHENQALTVESVSLFQGQPRWYRTAIHPLHDVSGSVVAVLVNATDIHELKTTQQELLALTRTLEERVEERTAQVQDLYDNAPVAYHSLDANGDLIAVNQTELNWLGYTREELLGNSFTKILIDEDIPRFLDKFSEMKATGIPEKIEFRVKRKDGTTFPVIKGATAVFDAKGDFVSSRVSMVDISERKQTEQALRDSETQNRFLFEESPVASALLDAEGIVVRTNRAFQQLLGFTAEQVERKAARSLGLLSPNGFDQIRDLLLGAQSVSEPSLAVEHALRRADGSHFDAAIRTFTFTLDGAKYVLVTTTDVSAYKTVEGLLRRANIELEYAMRMKDEFLANMSHELRTPLTGILGLTESMLLQIAGPLTERQVKYLDNIQSSGRHLLALINDILDLSKIQSGTLDLEPENLDVGEICAASLAFVKEPAFKKEISVSFHSDPAAISMVADVRRLKQILVNLLSNAVKFTPAHGHVQLAVEADPQHALIRFTVADTGIGIAAEDLKRLFTPFTQVDSSLARRHEGTGLGLALVKQLAELHGGQVRAESEPGKGSRFIVTIPWRQPPAADAAPATAVSPAAGYAGAPARWRILLAEDNETVADFTRNYLETNGYEVVVARDGNTVLAMVADFQPDLVLMDIQMPDMDGFEVTRRLRHLPEFQTMPIIAWTALAMAGDREQCLAAGADEYLSKPFSLPALLQSIETLLQPGRT